MSAESPPQIDLVSVDEHAVVSLQKNLANLTIMADNIRKKSDLDETKKQLKSCHCNYRLGDNPDERQMMKALAVAVNQAIQKKKIEPVNRNDRKFKVNKELYDLLAGGYETNKSPQEYFRKNVDLQKGLSSPRDLAEACLKSNAPQWLVASMIQHQFEIKWDPDSGEPDDYSFWEFYVTESTQKYFKYKPRLAHVKTTLYKEYCRRPEQYNKILDDALRSPKNTLCPEVYFSTINGWKAWQAYDEEDNKEDEFREVNFSDEFSEWSGKDILNFIEEYAKKQTLDDVSLENGKTHPLEKPTLYWAVINDSDFLCYEDELKDLKSKSIGQTQVYVGKANNGIKGRWLDDDSNHCEMMKKCLDNVCAMTTYDPLRLEGIQLVDARLALAQVRREKIALFVIETFGDDLETLKNEVLGIQTSLNQVDDNPIFGDHELEQRKKELKSALKNAEDRLKSRETAVKQELKEKETSHLNGELGVKIPNNEEWKPTDMKFGMNGHN